MCGRIISVCVFPVHKYMLKSDAPPHRKTLVAAFVLSFIFRGKRVQSIQIHHHLTFFRLMTAPSLSLSLFLYRPSMHTQKNSAHTSYASPDSDWCFLFLEEREFNPFKSITTVPYFLSRLMTAPSLSLSRCFSTAPQCTHKKIQHTHHTHLPILACVFNDPILSKKLGNSTEQLFKFKQQSTKNVR